MIATILISIGLVIAFAYSIYSIISKKKKGNGCSGNCNQCSGCGKLNCF